MLSWKWDLQNPDADVIVIVAFSEEVWSGP
jgi:hypothetical protein